MKSHGKGPRDWWPDLKLQEEFVDAIREVLGLAPLPRAGRGYQAMRRLAREADAHQAAK
jgi:hypothetical protein